MSLPKPPAHEHLTRKQLQYLIYQEGASVCVWGGGGGVEAEREEVVKGREACNLKEIKWKVNWKEKLKEASGNCKRVVLEEVAESKGDEKNENFCRALESLRMQNRG